MTETPEVTPDKAPGMSTSAPAVSAVETVAEDVAKVAPVVAVDLAAAEPELDAAGSRVVHAAHMTDAEIARLRSELARMWPVSGWFEKR